MSRNLGSLAVIPKTCIWCKKKIQSEPFQEVFCSVKCSIELQEEALRIEKAYGWNE